MDEQDWFGGEITYIVVADGRDLISVEKPEAAEEIASVLIRHAVVKNVGVRKHESPKYQRGTREFCEAQ